jgi:hypothetical protein
MPWLFSSEKNSCQWNGPWGDAVIEYVSSRTRKGSSLAVERVTVLYQSSKLTNERQAVWYAWLYKQGKAGEEVALRPPKINSKRQPPGWCNNKPA